MAAWRRPTSFRPADPVTLMRRIVFFLPKCGKSRIDTLVVVVGCGLRFRREQSSRKPSEGALEGGRRGLFRAKATRESRHGRRPWTAFFCADRRRFAGQPGGVYGLGDITSGGPGSLVVRLFAADAARVPALRGRATGRSGSRR